MATSTDTKLTKSQLRSQLTTACVLGERHRNPAQEIAAKIQITTATLDHHHASWSIRKSYDTSNITIMTGSTNFFRMTIFFLVSILMFQITLAAGPTSRSFTPVLRSSSSWGVRGGGGDQLRGPSRRENKSKARRRNKDEKSAFATIDCRNSDPEQDLDELDLSAKFFLIFVRF